MTVEEHDTPPASLGRRATQAIWWIGASSFASAGLRLVSSLILTRLLAPDLYGIMAVAQSLLFGLSMLSDVGLHHALTRSDRADDPRYLHAIWTLQAIRGMWISVLMVLAGGVLFALQGLAPQWLGDSVYAHPDVPGVLALIALAPLIDGHDSIRSALAQRNMNLGRVSLLGLGVQAITIALTIVLAKAMPSVWVLAGMSVVSSALKCAGTYLMLPGPSSRWHYDAQVARETWQFGRWILASSALAFLATNGDRMLLAALATPTLLGHFAIARNLAGLPSELITRVIGSVGYSTLCEIARDRPKELHEAFARMQRKVDLACMSGVGLLLPLGPLVVAVLYDDRYLEAGWMMSLLSLSLLLMRYMLLDQLSVALGDTAWMARKQAVSLVSLVGGIALGYQVFGVNGAVIGAALGPLGSLPMTVLRMRRMGVLDRAVELRAWGILGGTALLGVGVDHAVRTLAAALGYPLPAA